jgi:hypothetical protein
MVWTLLGATGQDFARSRSPDQRMLDEADIHAWADAEGVQVDIRYGTEFIYLSIANRRPTAYSGLLTYRAPDGAVLHLHAGLGANRSGLALLRADEVAGAAFDGDGSEGGWLARGLHTSVVFSSGAGGVAPCGGGVLLVAPQSGRFQLRRGEGWGSMAAHRLLLSGELLPAPLQIDASHLSIAYVAEDEHGPTDLYLVLPIQAPLPDRLRAYLGALLAARAAALRRAAHLAGTHDAAVAKALAAAAGLAATPTQPATLDEYTAARRTAVETTRPALAALSEARHAAWAAYLGGAIEQEEYERTDARLALVADIAATLGPRNP